ncbi:MAG TPA: lysine biosynthesis protein LysX [Thermomicrobiales bacterium]|nr:lysine biosynthesis protein LysX [Thermomicrobiales bacterium]
MQHAERIVRHDLRVPHPASRVPTLGLLVSHLRDEEKMILAAAERQGVETLMLPDRSLLLDLSQAEPPAVDLVLDRCIAHTRGSYALRVFESWGIPTLNPSSAVMIADDKAMMSAAFARAGVPTPRTAIAFTIDSALEIGERFGYPLIVKPVSGSWGRLLARANSPAALREIVEQKGALGGPQHRVLYLQEYIDKPGRDIRAFYVGGDVIAASYRSAEHWITNVARGAVSTECPITPEIVDIARRAAHSVGAEIAGIDLVETDDGLKVIEINGGAEFKGLLGTTNVPIADLIVEFAVAKMAMKPA